MACEVCGKSSVCIADDNFDSDAKPHVCTTCGQSFSLKIQLKRHTLHHANGESYVCVLCSKTTEEESKSYNLRLSKKSDRYPCDTCGESFSSKRMLLRHTTKEHVYEKDDSEADDSDDYSHPRKRKTKQYQRSKKKITLPKRTDPSEVVQEKSNKPFVCTTCLKSFAYQTFLDRHIRDGKCKTPKLPSITIKARKDNKKHRCNVCGKGFTRKSSLEGHELTHVKEGFVSTPEEDNASSTDEFMEEEEEDKSSRRYTPKKPKINIKKSYTCDHCNYVCFSKLTLDKHLANHKAKEVRVVTELIGGTAEDNRILAVNSGVVTSNSNEDENRKENEKETHSCEICDKVFHTKGRLKRHLLFHVKSDDEEQPSKWEWSASGRKKKRSKDFSCEVCGKQFAGLTCLRKHSLKHTSSGRTEVRRSSSTTTSSKKKKEVLPMECEFCHEVFTGKRSVYVKHLHSHTPEVCGICDQRFVDRASLREHCRVHVGTEEGRMFMECSQKALDAKNGLLPPEPKVEYIYLVLR